MWATIDEVLQNVKALDDRTNALIKSENIVVKLTKLKEKVINHGVSREQAVWITEVERALKIHGTLVLSEFSADTSMFMVRATVSEIDNLLKVLSK